MKKTKINEEKRRKNLIHKLTTFAVLVAVIILVLTPYITHFFLSDNLCFHQEDLKEYPHICEEGKKILEKLDPHTKITYRFNKQIANHRYEEFPEGKLITPPKDQLRTLPKKEILFGLTIPTLEDDFGAITLFEDITQKAVYEFFRVKYLHPLQDIETHWQSIDQSQRISKVITENDLRSLSLTEWDDVTSDFTITRICFSGIAAHNIKRVSDEDPEVEFISDWTFIKGFKLRPGFEDYGASAYFSSNGTLLKLFWSLENRFVYPPIHGKISKEWEHAKWVFKCTVIVAVTAREHLIGLHLMAANFLTTALKEQVPGTHPISRLLKPHTFGTVSINLGAAETLAVNLGFFHRSTAFEWESIEEISRIVFSSIRFLSPLETLQLNGVHDIPEELYPFGQDLKDFTQVVRDYVNGYIDIYYPSDRSVFEDVYLQKFWYSLRTSRRRSSPLKNEKSTIPTLSGRKALAEVLSDYIIHVTGYHNHVGNVADYLKDPKFVCGKIRSGREICDIQATFQGINIALLTAQRKPKLLNDFTHLLLKDENLKQTKNVMRKFQNDLMELSEKIENKNKIRKIPCNSFNPSKMMASISI